MIYEELKLEEVLEKYKRGEELHKFEIILLKNEGIIPYEDEKDRINRGWDEEDSLDHETDKITNGHINDPNLPNSNLLQIHAAVQDYKATKEF